MTARHQGKSSIAEFNAWYSSSTANIEASELFVVNELEATRSPLRVADALEQAWEAGNYLPEASELRKKIKEYMEGYALQYVQGVIDRLHKYAIYV
ncbi:MAG: hypothetical protein GX860_09685 [Alcaligenaceae bacterium]|nr:hypothetical protein [Alcaligenaceae bacterium]